jgi:hypothetical protein
VHCAAAPQRQAAWDLVARDLRGAPFNYGSEQAFVVGNKLFYQGSGNIGAWYACTCGASSSGCAAASGYMQWLTADDDNGNLSDGTPHMTALSAAFNRHGIGCATPAPQNSGCAAGPGAAPTLGGTAGGNSTSLSWNGVAGAARYWVFRSEGHAGCDFGKALIADVTGTSFGDTQVANGRDYYYNVVAAGTSTACYTAPSNCLTLTPNGAPPPPTGDFAISAAPAARSVRKGGSTSYTVTVTPSGGFTGTVTFSASGLPSGATASFNPASVAGSGSSTMTVATARNTTRGTFTVTVRGTSGSLVHTATVQLTVTK